MDEGGDGGGECGGVEKWVFGDDLVRCQGRCDVLGKTYMGVANGCEFVAHAEDETEQG
jgi:hypothetical protein